MNDKKLRKAVIDQLDFEPGIDSADIGVAAEAHVVTLTGHVPNYAQKVAAERAAWRVKGVQAVVDNLKVRYAAEPASDGEIAKRALSSLQWDATLPSDLRVTVNNGWVILEGQVQWQFQRENAGKDVRKLFGVMGITNNITLKPVARTATVKQRIEDALKRNAEVEAALIRVDIEGGDTVTLDGKVDTWSERMAVQHAAWSAPGVKSVIDHLTIG
ncbi:BON domain protein [Lysobacter capsici]|uniref:BON domain-containing protein n=1 Tax=Lysobacter capsici TaxID=435897 RepID=UPI0007166884|nr:BON domain-containing protein [Lysobacter capsici]ALN88620.1 BON domain protein [Lysobacter capsici]